MASPADRLVSKYLKSLRADLSGLPAARRKEVVGATERRIAAERSRLPSQSEDEVRALLDRIGDPADIAAAAWTPYGFVRSTTPRREVSALVLLLVGGCVLIVGWIAGVVLLWSSRAWTTRDKLIGTLIVPGGLALPMAFVLADGVGSSSGSEQCDSASVHCPHIQGGHDRFSMVLIGALVAVQIAVVLYLGLRLRARPAAEPAVPLTGDG